MKRTIAALSIALVLAVTAIAQSPRSAKNADCGSCCGSTCGQTCCQGGCNGSCCQGK